ncbi:hypothetical protein CEXT_110651 [Caerostris extrusa]|uniref:Uncharacterized protein n=1 Tax=Caerostris extrusa TaxID=172846 RepID=A0AAV4MTY5_CAEEX|nr:hypothetical protein CEXT_110651 [Caerostris extrusa]
MTFLMNAYGMYNLLNVNLEKVRFLLLNIFKTNDSSVSNHDCCSKAKTTTEHKQEEKMPISRQSFEYPTCSYEAAFCGKR